MRTLIIPFLLAAAGSANAQPAAPAPPAAACSVTIVRAPDAVRETIQQWLAKEHCTLALQVRIIPTEGGLYLLANDEHGRVRERIVPDAASAGVLIASWAADDGLGGAAPPSFSGAPSATPPAPAYSAPAYTGPAPSYPPLAYAPGTAQVTAFGPGDFHPTTHDDDDDGEPTKVVESPQPAKHFTFAAGFGTNGSGALRAELDLYGKNGWTLGAAFGLAASEMNTYDNYSNATYYDAHITDYSLSLTAGHTWWAGDWELRAGAGLGLVVSTMNLDNYNYQTGAYQSGSGSMTSPYVEAAVMVGHSFGAAKQWGVEAGPVVSYTKQEWYLADTMSTLYREGGNAVFVVGLRHGL